MRNVRNILKHFKENTNCIIRDICGFIIGVFLLCIGMFGIVTNEKEFELPHTEEVVEAGQKPTTYKNDISLDFTFITKWKDCASFLANNDTNLTLRKEKGTFYLEWDEVPNATGYMICSSSEEDGEYNVIGASGITTYKSHKLIMGEEHYFKVQPYIKIDDKCILGDLSNSKIINVTRLCLPVDYICQLPELPTGCEATSLTMVLNYHDYDVAKETIASEYMPRDSQPGDFYNYFLGDPFSDTGLGIFAPGLATTANNYLQAMNSEMKAYDLTGCSIEDLCEYIAEGYPICIWTTCNLYKDPEINAIWEIDGKSYVWMYNQHCMTLVGFDSEKDTLIVMDPSKGKMEYSTSLIEKRYEQYNNMAVVVK